MRLRVQFGVWLCGLGLSAALLAPCAPAQQRSKDQAPPREQHRPPNAGQSNRQQRNAPVYHPQSSPRSGRNDAPQYRAPRDNRPSANDNRRPNYDNRPAGQYHAPAQNPQEQLRNMTPADRQRLAQREEQFHHLPPAQQQQLRDSARVWQKMTPEQRDHIRNDILPKWKEMSPDRQKAIQHRLGVLQNMPESARNRHLNDPSFTRGMSEEDKEMLRDLSHQHVGAPPEPPSE